jgi:hypothetical protein
MENLEGVTPDAQHPQPAPHLVEVHVNEQPVQVPHKTTGIAIKQAAIAQGVKIQLDFILSEERGQGKDRIIGDNDEVEVNRHSRFLAVAPDDNS